MLDIDSHTFPFKNVSPVFINLSCMVNCENMWLCSLIIKKKLSESPYYAIVIF